MSSAYRNIAAQHAPILQPTFESFTNITNSSINTPNNTGESIYLLMQCQNNSILKNGCSAKFGSSLSNGFGVCGEHWKLVPGPTPWFGLSTAKMFPFLQGIIVPNFVVLYQTAWACIHDRWKCRHPQAGDTVLWKKEQLHFVIYLQ